MNPFALPGWPAVFWLPSRLYRAASLARRNAYARGYAETVRLPVPVFCVGNLTVGGSGKTPVTIWLAEFLKSAGRRPAVLSRGHGRASRGPVLVANRGEVLPPSQDMGDEPRLIAERLPGVPVAVDADRVRAGRLALEAWSPGCLVLDDGYQHHRLHRDRDILCLDARLAHAVFVEGAAARPLPAGPWREGPDAVDRAHVLALTRAERLDGDQRRALEKKLAPLGKPLAWARYKTVVPGAPLRGQAVLALSALADPAPFEEALKAQGAEVMALRRPDHHYFTPGDLEEARRPGRRIVTTEKDRQRLPGDFPADAARLDLEWESTAWTSEIASAFA